MDKNKGSISFLGLLQVSLIVLKLTGVITFSWILVLSPLIACTIAYIIAMVIFIAFL